MSQLQHMEGGEEKEEEEERRGIVDGARVKPSPGQTVLYKWNIPHTAIRAAMEMEGLRWSLCWKAPQILPRWLQVGLVPSLMGVWCQVHADDSLLILISSCNVHSYVCQGDCPWWLVFRDLL